MTIENTAPKPSPAPPARPLQGDWRIDAQTRRLGLVGVARARAVLEASRARHSQPDAA